MFVSCCSSMPANYLAIAYMCMQGQPQAAVEPKVRAIEKTKDSLWNDITGCGTTYPAVSKYPLTEKLRYRICLCIQTQFCEGPSVLRGHVCAFCLVSACTACWRVDSPTLACCANRSQSKRVLSVYSVHFVLSFLPLNAGSSSSTQQTKHLSSFLSSREQALYLKTSHAHTRRNMLLLSQLISGLAHVHQAGSSHLCAASSPLMSLRILCLRKNKRRSMATLSPTGVIHRDLKPSNVFMTARSGDHRGSRSCRPSVPILSPRFTHTIHR
jgi:hypothetical protein